MSKLMRSVLIILRELSLVYRHRVFRRGWIVGISLGLIAQLTLARYGVPPYSGFPLLKLIQILIVNTIMVLGSKILDVVHSEDLGEGYDIEVTWLER